MVVLVRCFAVLRELSADRSELALADGASIDDAWGALTDRYPALSTPDPKGPVEVVPPKETLTGNYV